MISSYQFGWATLTWWSWPLLALVVMGSVWLAVRLTVADEKDLTRQCALLVWTERKAYRWCHLPYGHHEECRDADGWSATDYHEAREREAALKRRQALCTATHDCYLPDGHAHECFPRPSPYCGG